MFKQKTLSAGARFGLFVATCVLGLALCLSTLMAGLISNIQSATDKESVAGLIKEFMMKDFVAEEEAPSDHESATPIAQTMSHESDDPADVATDLTQQLIDQFYDSVSQQLGEFPVSKEDFVEMINKSTVKDYIADKTASLLVDYYNDEVTTTFEPEEIVNLIHENKELIVEVTGEAIPDDISEQVAKVFDDNEIVQKVEEEGLAAFMNPEDLKFPGLGADQEDMSLREAMDALRNFASSDNLLLCIFVSVGLILIILLVNVKQLGKGLRRAGFWVMMAGLPVTVVLAKPDLLAEIPYSELLVYILQQGAGMYGWIIGVGAALIVGGIVASVLFSRRGTYSYND